MPNQASFLDDRGVVRVGGEDAASFLQGLLTNDVETLNVGEARYAGLLTPQGKILFDMIVVRAAAETGAAFLVDCSASQAADLAKRLGFYKLRAKVAIADESARLGVVAFWGAAPDLPAEGVLYADPRDARLGSRAILPRAAATAVGAAALPAYEALRIEAVAPKGGVDFAYGDVFPQDANFDLLNGVDFKKGCYVGQEVVSRMKHRGTGRKRIVRVTLAAAPPPPGASILDGELPVGTLGAASGREALALLRLDRAEEAKAAGRALKADDVNIIVR
jgi:folate-binding protein YgfZ